MKRESRQQRRGAAALIYMGLVAMLTALILSIGYSRMMLSIKRSTALSDRVVANYRAEYEMNDALVKVLAGYVEDPEDLGGKKQVGKTAVDLEVETKGGTQTLVVLARRAFSVTKLKAVTVSETEGENTGAEIVLTLDCTSSMDRSATGSGGPTRMEEQKEAALNFIDALSEAGYETKLGVAVFGINAGWLRDGGEEVTPGSMTLAEVREAVEAGFGDRRANSSACRAVDDYTSIGNGLALMNDYYRSVPPEEDTLRFEVLISDGEPNSRSDYYGGCLPSTFCRDCPDETLRLLKCTLADSETQYDGANFGDRDPEVRVYVITVLETPARKDVRNALVEFSTQYYNLKTADGLTAALEAVFEEISSTFSTTTLTRLVPEPE